MNILMVSVRNVVHYSLNNDTVVVGNCSVRFRKFLFGFHDRLQSSYDRVPLNFQVERGKYNRL